MKERRKRGKQGGGASGEGMEEARIGRKARKEAATEEKRERENGGDRKGELLRGLVERRDE